MIQKPKHAILILLILCLVPSVASHAGKDKHPTLGEETTFKLPATVVFLRRAIKEELSADKINFETFKAILNDHARVVQVDTFAQKYEPKRASAFESPEGCEFHNPSFCAYSCDESFAGRCSSACCVGSDEDVSCCTCLMYLPCSLIQVMCGCFLPCGYSDGCCCEVTPKTRLEQEMKEHLKGLGTLYDDKYWDEIVKIADDKI